MTGPEHYREAERLIESVTRPGALVAGNRVLDPDLSYARRDYLTLAQVHATLALAAAKAADRYPQSAAIAEGWREVTS